MKHLLILVLFTIIQVSSFANTSSITNEKEVVVLVPGFFNSFAPEYFSDDIIRTLKQKDFKVYVAQGLNPIGTVEDNGSRLENILQNIEKAENKKINFNIIGHSAGGFYTMWVANRQHFKIKNILTVSTPYKGVEFVENWRNNFILFKTLTDLAHLDGLTQLTPDGVKTFLGQIRISPETKIFAFGGYQSESLDITDAQNISIPLRVTSYFISEKSDGIVGYSSALGLGSIKTTDNKIAQQYSFDKYFLNLEHWEQVLDSQSFIFLGIRNTDFIKNEQIRFYSGLADFLKQQNH